jgi:hypothetical protein
MIGKLFLNLFLFAFNSKQRSKRNEQRTVFRFDSFFKIFKGKNANAAALILLVIAGVTATGLYAKHNYDAISIDNSLTGEITTEVDIAVQNAVLHGLNDFLKNGFSKNNEVWYCNYPYPVGFDEAKNSLQYFVDKRVDIYLDELRDQGYTISDPEIEFPDFNGPQGDIPEDSITVKVDNLKVGINTDTLIQEQDISREYVYDWPIMKIYNSMDEWMGEDGGGIIENIYDEVFYDKSCQIIHSRCNCTEDRMISQDLRDSIKLKLEDVYPALDKSMDALNDKFAGTDIVCNYSVEKYHIENVEKFTYSEAQTSYLNYTSDVLEWDENLYNYDYEMWTDDFTLPGPGRDGLTELGGCPTWEDDVDATKRPQLEIDTTLSESNYESEDSEICTYSTLSYRMHNEEFAIDKKLGLLLKIKCEDPTISIEDETEITNLNSQIASRISVQLECPTPSEEDVDDKVILDNGDVVDTSDDDGTGMTYACPGGDGCCFTKGTPISMADGTKKNIEKVKIGDKILGFDFETNEEIEVIVEEMQYPIRNEYFVLRLADGTILNVTDDHPIWVKSESYEGWGSIVPEITYNTYILYDKDTNPVIRMKVGMDVFKLGKIWSKIVSIERIEGKIQTYNLKNVTKTGNFYADEVLVHNRGVRGLIGPLCIIEQPCETCFGCALDGNGDPTCVPAPMTECPGVCTLCSDTGACDEPALRGTPCTSEGDCMLCDGISSGVAGCTLQDPPDIISLELDCSVPCRKCAGDGSGCTAFIEEVGDQDDCPDCQTCGTTGECVASDIGSDCGKCLVCSSTGQCSEPDFNADDGCATCKRCGISATCVYDEIFTGIDNDCGTCQKCGPAGCEPDFDKNGDSCGKCKTCNMGFCNGNKPDGTECGSNNGCTKGCQDGECKIGLNVGASCDSNYECASSRCSSQGNCELATSMSGKQCCGDKLCNDGDPCCPYGGWQCGACDDTTT